MAQNYDDTFLDPDQADPRGQRGSGAAARAAARAAGANDPPPQGAVDRPAKPTTPIITSPIVVPTDLYDYATRVAHEIAASANIDEDTFRAMFFAIINQESGWNPNSKDNVNVDGTKDRGIAQMNSGPNGSFDRSRGVTEQTQPGGVGWDRSVYNPEFALRWAAQHLADLYGQVPGSGIDKWRNAAAAYNGGMGGYGNAGPQAYATSVLAQAATPAGIQAGAKAGYDPGGTSASDIPGLTHEQSLAARRVADQDYIDILGRLPTPAEYADILAHGFTPVTLSDHLRAQPNPNAPGTTVGQWVDARAAAVKWANATLGRDPSDGEINWLIQNKVPVNDESVSAFFEQIRTGAVWVSQRADGTPVHPDDWRATRTMIQKVWADLGLQGDVDAAVVNQAVAGRWTTSQARDYFRAQQAPGYPPGTTVGQVEQTANMVSTIKSDLFPGETVNETELKQFVGMTPEQIRKLLRDRPSKNVPGVTVGAERDTRTMAETFFKNAGIPNTEIKPEDLRYLSLTGADPQAIAEYFSSKTDLVGKYPGLPYGLGSQDYQLALSQYADALSSVFGAGSPMIADALRAPRPGAPAADRAGSLVGAAMTSKVGAAEFGQTVEDFRQRTGRAPSGSEFTKARTAPQQRTGGQGASGNIKEPGTPAEERGAARPAVGARA